MFNYFHCPFYFIIFFISFNLFALIDYSDEALEQREYSFKHKNKRPKRPSPKKSPVKKEYGQKKSFKRLSNSKGRSKSNSTQKYFDLMMRYEISKVNNQVDTQIGLFRMEGQIRNILDMFMNLSYFGGKTFDNSLNNDGQESSFQKGNATGILGFNWIKLGGNFFVAHVDLYAGGSLATKNSLIGSSRNDKIVGLQTTKRLLNVFLVLHGELRFTGRPKDANELAIGNISKLYMGANWVASPDIKVNLSGHIYRIKASSREDIPYRLGQNLSFSTVSANLLLGLYPPIEFVLSSTLQVKKIPNDRYLLDAKLFEFNGAYGNSFSLGMNVSL